MAATTESIKSNTKTFKMGWVVIAIVTLVTIFLIYSFNIISIDKIFVVGLLIFAFLWLIFLQYKPSRRISLLSSEQAASLKVQYARVNTELLELQLQLEAAGVVPVGGWRPGGFEPGDSETSPCYDCGETICDTECDIVCYQGCPNDCDDSCEDVVCEDSNIFLDPLERDNIIQQIVMPSTQLKGILLSRATRQVTNK